MSETWKQLDFQGYLMHTARYADIISRSQVRYRATGLMWKHRYLNLVFQIFRAHRHQKTEKLFSMVSWTRFKNTTVRQKNTCIYKWIHGSQIHLICPEKEFTNEFDLSYNLAINMLKTQRKTKPNNFACAYQLLWLQHSDCGVQKDRAIWVLQQNSPEQEAHQCGVSLSRNTAHKAAAAAAGSALPTPEQQEQPAGLEPEQHRRAGADVGSTDLAVLADHFLCSEQSKASWTLLGKCPFERKDGKRCSFSGRKEI